MDVANLLWRSRALTAHDPNAMACLCAPTLADSLHTYVTTTLSPITILTTNQPAPGTGPDYALTALFGLPHNPLTAPLALAAFRALEDHHHHVSTNNEESSPRHHHPPGPVTQRSLHRLARAGGLELSWKAYRVRVLEWLAERGVRGVRDFMFVTMKDLMREASNTAAAAAAATAAPAGGSGSGTATAVGEMTG